MSTTKFLTIYHLYTYNFKDHVMHKQQIDKSIIIYDTCKIWTLKKFQARWKNVCGLNYITSKIFVFDFSGQFKIYLSVLCSTVKPDSFSGERAVLN
jgi:hypothetical protein